VRLTDCQHLKGTHVNIIKHTMPDYQLSKIYKIEVPNQGLYVGNTSQQKLSSRRAGHVRDSIHIPDSIPLYSAINSRPEKWEGIKIILLENFPCTNHDELEARYQDWVCRLKPNLNPDRVTPEQKAEAKRMSTVADCSKWGKIYKIVIGKEMYIGSTGRRRSSFRRTGHVVHSKLPEYADYPLYKLVNSLPKKWNGITLELLEDFPCSFATELHKREGYWIILLKPSLNQTVAGRDAKECREDHMEKCKEYSRQRYLANKELFAVQHQVRAKIRKVCSICGTEISQYHLRRHISLVHKETSIGQ
jgi:hypothetical protein